MSEPLSRVLGTAERRMQALLQSLLRAQGVSFAEWVAMTVLQGPGGMDRAGLERVLAAGQVPVEGDVVAGLVARGWVVEDERLEVTATGRAVYAPLRARVAAAVDEIESGVPEEDLEVARRVLGLVAARAEAILARGA